MEELLKQLADIDGQIDVLLQNDELDDAQRAQHDKLVANRKKVTAQIAREQDKLDREAERQHLAETEAKRQRVVAAPAPNTNRLAKPDTAKVTVPAEVTDKVITLANGAKVTRAWMADPKRGFESHAEYLKAVMDAGMGIRSDPRLRPLVSSVRNSDEEDGPSHIRGSDYIVPLAFTPTGLASMTSVALYNSHGRQMTAGSDEQGLYSDPYGGYLKKTSMRSEMLKVGTEDDPIGPLTTKIPMDAPTVKIPARVDKNHTTSVSGGFRVYRRSETQSVGLSRMEMETVQLDAIPLFGAAAATEELLQYSLPAFIAIIKAGFQDEFPAKLMRERLEGTGVGQYEGVLNSDCIVSVAAESGQSVDTIVLDNIYKMRSRCWKYSRAIWTANHDTLPQLATLNAVVGTGGVPFWQPSAREDHPDMLMGRPLYFTEFQPKVGDTGDLLLGVWSEYLEGQLSPVQDAESMHVRFLEHERVFKFFTYNAGRVWWRSALTPAKSSDTLSPFVKLAAR